MKFLLSVLLLISGLFSIIRTGMSLSCFQNDNAKECLGLLLHLSLEQDRRNSSETELDRMRQRAMRCMKNSHEKLELIPCDQTRKCNKLNVKFQDEDEMSFKFCDTDESGRTCDLAKVLLIGDFEHHLDSATCEYCETDECNGDSKGKDIMCYETHFQDKCAYKMVPLVEAAKEKKENFDELKSSALSCWKRERTENLVPCTGGVCYTLTMKFKDGTQVISKGCDDTNYHVRCKASQDVFEIMLTPLLSSAHCDVCSEDSCNNALVGSSHPEDAPSNLTCWVTQLEFMCELELMKWYKAQAGLQGNPDKLRSEALKCLKGNQTDVLVACRKKNSVCSELTLDFKDDDKTVFKFCDSESICQKFKKLLENDFKAELKSAQCECVDGCNSDQNGPSSEIPNSGPEVKQNQSSSRSSSSCIHLSVFAWFLILGALFI